jgi:hypothetical protein
MVKMNKEVANKQPEQDLEDEFKEGCNFTFTESKTPHGEWFANDPKGACDSIEGVKFVQRTRVHVSRKPDKQSAFVVSLLCLRLAIPLFLRFLSWTLFLRDQWEPIQDR